MNRSRFVADMRSLFASGFFEWDVKPLTHLPPGLWVKRLCATGTVLDMFHPEYIHPLHLLSVRAGRFALGDERTQYARVVKAQMTFLNALQFWGEALDIPRGEVAKWYWKLTPPATPEPPAEMRFVADLLLVQQESLWASIGLPQSALDDTLKAIGDPTKTYGPATYRPRFWTEEVRLR